MCEDIALTRDETEALLAQAPNHRKWWADHYPYGGILWRRSKRDYFRFTPFARAARREIDRWKAMHPDWRPGVPLFPQLKTHKKPVTYSQIRDWLKKAHEIAPQDLEKLAIPQQEISRWMSGSMIHGWRDHFATKLDELGYGWEVAKDANSKLDLHNHVAFCGDWATSGGDQSKIYAKLNPGVLQAIMEFERAESVCRRFSVQAADDVADTLAAIYEDEEGVIPIEAARMRR
jgi:hypothetical protein